MADIIKDKEERRKRFIRAVLLKYPWAEIEHIGKIRYRTRKGVNVSINLESVYSSWITHYLEICRDLKIDPYDLLPLESYTENRMENVLENKLLAYYCDFNMKGRRRVMELLEDMHRMEHYRRV